MQILVSTDANIDGREAFTSHVEAGVEAALERFAEHVTRVEVHLSDQSAATSGAASKRCLIEARLASRQPVAATDDGATPEEAFSGAAKKLHRLLEAALGRSGHHKGAASIRTTDTP